MVMRLGAGIGIALAAATPLAAQDGRAPPPITRADFMARVDRRFAEIDANRDGAITPGEIADERYARMRARMKARRDRAFALLDTNHDGTLSRAEFEAGRPHGFGPGAPDDKGEHRPHGMEDGGVPLDSPGWFEMADANNDGRVTLAEARAAAGALFDRIDRNHDGTISPDEHLGGTHGDMPRRDGPPGGDMPPPPRG